MNQSMKKRLKALEGQITTKDKTITAIERRFVGAEGGCTGQFYRVDLLSDEKKRLWAFDRSLTGKSERSPSPKMDDEDS